MFKIKSKYLILVAILVLGTILISGCSGECKANPDCTAGKCQSAKCVDKKCEYTDVENCCGNNIKEELENGKPGNKCTCPDDYGTCLGIGKLTIRNRQYNAQYLKYLCKNDKCALGYDDSIVSEIPLVSENNFNYFKLESAINFNMPFDIDMHKFKLRFTLKDDHEDLVYPLKLTNIKFLSGAILLGEKQLEIEFSKVGESFNVDVPISYITQQIEEERQVSYKVDFTYAIRKLVRKEDGTYGYETQAPERSSFENRFGSVFFINPGGEDG